MERKYFPVFPNFFIYNKVIKIGGGNTARAKVSIVHQTSTGLNDKLNVNGKVITNNKAYTQAKRGNINGFHGVNNHGTKYIRSNPDSKLNNNLEK